MVSENIESIGGHGYGGYGYGGGWGIPPVGLFGVIGGRGFGHDDHNNHGRCFEECCCDIRADIGETKFKVAETTLGQTNTLMKEMCDLGYQSANNTFQLEKELFGIQKDVLNCCCETKQTVMAGDNMLEKSILIQGYQNQLANCQQTNTLSRQISDCCCETNLNIERTAFATQLRDLENKCDTDRQLAEIKCLITDTAKDTELATLRRDAERGFISCEINKAINATIGSWSAAAQFNGVTYPQPPFSGWNCCR